MALCVPGSLSPTESSHGHLGDTLPPWQGGQGPCPSRPRSEDMLLVLSVLPPCGPDFTAFGRFAT